MPPLPRLRIASLAQLAGEAAFAPPETVRGHLERAEALAAEIDPAINYPEDWIVFRITAERPEMETPAIVVGEALLGDISALVERLSAAARLSAADLEPGRWLSADEVCARWKISRKTLERWRRLGLVARRVRGENGKPRLAFPLAAVERFERERKDRVEGAAAYSRIEPRVAARMVRRAAAYARLGCSLNQAAERIAARYGRGLETVRQLIRRSEAGALFDDRGPPSERERRLIERAWWLAIEPRVVAKRLKRSAPSVLRVAIDQRSARLRATLVEAEGAATNDTPEAPEAAPAGLESLLSSELVVRGLGAPGETDLLAFVEAARAGGAPIGAAERARARAYRALVARARASALLLPRHGASGAVVDAIETDLRWAVRLKAELVRSQLPLLVRTLEAAVSRPLEEVRAGVLSLLIAEGLGAIAEAVEHFDPEKGGRLAAPAGIAVQRAAARVLRDHAAELRPARGRAVPRLTPGVRIEDWTRRLAPWQSWRGGTWLEPPARVRAGAARLDPRLRMVLELRYGWGPAPVTVAVLGERMRMPAMRAAVVERRALREAWRLGGDTAGG